MLAASACVGRPLTTCSDVGSYAMKRRSEEHTSELQSRFDLVCRLLLEKKLAAIGLAAPYPFATMRLGATPLLPRSARTAAARACGRLRLVALAPRLSL